eukprot:807290-Prymnesium_polylepis.1
MGGSDCDKDTGIQEAHQEVHGAVWCRAALQQVPSRDLGGHGFARQLYDVPDRETLQVLDAGSGLLGAYAQDGYHLQCTFWRGNHPSGVCG